MSHKELCADWVEARKYEDDDGWWELDIPDGETISGPYAAETELDDVLWRKACEQSFASLGVG